MKYFVLSLVWLLVFLTTYAAFSLLGAAPAEVEEFNWRAWRSVKAVFAKIVPAGSNPTDPLTAASTTKTTDAIADGQWESILPEKIIIEKIGVSSAVVNPTSSDLPVLDEALRSGVVRYPGSGGLEDESNMFLFGHSTPLREVKNSAYRAFNRLNELRLGDRIIVSSKADEYIYKVKAVYEVDENAAHVQFKRGEKMLTISTCDSFGNKTSRIVVEAAFTGLKIPAMSAGSTGRENALAIFLPASKVMDIR